MSSNQNLLVLNDYNNARLHISDIELNPENPRIEKQDNPFDAFIEMTKDVENEIINMMQDIASRGKLSPLDMVSVISNPGTSSGYIVSEGNRRLAALKLLFNQLPSKMLSAKGQSRYATIQAEARKNGLDLQLNPQINVVILDDEEADDWNEVKHGGQQGGVGQVPWSPLAKARHQKKRRKKVNLGLEVYEYYKRVMQTDTKSDDLNALKENSSTIDRILSNPESRDMLGLKRMSNTIQARFSKEFTNKAFKEIVDRFKSGDFDSRSLNKRNEIIDSITSLVNDIEAKGINRVVIEPWLFENERSGNNDELEKDTAKKNKDNKKKMPYDKPTLKTSVINDSFYASGSTAKRISKLIDEVKLLDGNEFVNVNSITIRVIVEMIVNYFIEKCIKKPQSRPPKHSKLKDRIEKCLKILDSRYNVDESKFYGMHQMLQEEDTLLTIGNLHQYVHNPNYHPNYEQLKHIWDNIESTLVEFMRVIEIEVNES